MYVYTHAIYIVCVCVYLVRRRCVESVSECWLGLAGSRREIERR